MANSLIPELNGRRLTVDVALQEQTAIRDQIARLADPVLLLPRFFTPLGKPVTGGGILYSQLKASDYLLATDVEKRSPGSEYAVMEGTQRDPMLALLEDWGGRFKVTAEEKRDNDTSKLDSEVTQLTNQLIRKLDTACLAAVEKNLTAENTITGNSWSAAVLVGPESELSPGDERPAADWADAQLAADLQELGIVHDMLVVHPNQARSLRIAYGEKLADILDSNGIKEMFVSPRIVAGTAYTLKKGDVGTVGFAEPLTVEVIPDKLTRSEWVQAFVVPAFTVERPSSVKKIVGIA